MSFRNNAKKKNSIRERQKKCKEVFFEELKKTPIVTVAAKRAGTSRATVYRWRDRSEAFKKKMDVAVHEGRDLVSDMAESQLVKKIQEGTFAAAKYWLEHHHGAYKKGSARRRMIKKSMLGSSGHRPDDYDPDEVVTITELLEELGKEAKRIDEENKRKEQGP